MKKIIAFLLVALSTYSTYSQKMNQDTAQQRMNIFIKDLMKKMTLEEKIGQLNLPTVGFDVTGPLLSSDVESKIRKGLAGAVFNTYTPVAVKKLQEMAVNETRMKIPLMFGYDVIHGHRTIFPINLGLAATWNPELIEKTARAAAEEASADGLNWVFSPMVDISRDPRWGRVSEGAGEDPFLGSLISAAMVKGYQGNDLSKNNTVMACVKHFALYGASEAGRDYNTVDMSHVKMYNEYFPPYYAAIQSGVGTVMTSFNTVDGIPASGNKWLMTDVLRNQWGFKGFVVTDYTAINEMVHHGMGDDKKVTELALKAGVDQDMVGEEYLKYAGNLVNEGVISEKIIDDACRLILEAKYKLGLFEDPYRYVSEERNKKEIMSEDKLELSRQAAIESMVLLKNKNEILPLKKNQKIAFIGPFIKDKRNLIGSWSGAGDYKKAISIWEALQKKGTQNISYALGCNMLDDTLLLNKLNPHDGQLVVDSKSPQDLIVEAVTSAIKSDVVVVALGEPFGMSGEAASLTDIGLPENQVALLKALKKTGKPIVLLLMSGRPLTLSWEESEMNAILETWYAGTMAGTAISDVLFGEAEPSGRLTMTFPRSVGQIPIYYNHLNTGRPLDKNQKYTTKYLDEENSPLYPFGYGLGYGKVNYSVITLDKNEIRPGQKINASITVSNVGKYATTETIQLYIRDLVASISRPVKELKGFQKVYLPPGASKTITFTISESDLKFYNSELQYDSEEGDFKLFLGRNSEELNSVDFKLIKP